MIPRCRCHWILSRDFRAISLELSHLLNATADNRILPVVSDNIGAILLEPGMREFYPIAAETDTNHPKVTWPAPQRR